MQYMPPITAANPVSHFVGPTHSAVLVRDIQSAGITQYHYLFIVFPRFGDDPCLIVSAELFAGGSHTVLGLFDDTGHQTLYSEVGDWSEITAFASRAVAIAGERFSTTFVEQPMTPQ